VNANVSVVMPHYNSSATVRRSIDSIVTQSLAVVELIIVDDGSEDTIELQSLVNDYIGKLEIKLILSEANRGASYARNLGVSLASGDYIAFLDSDDVWHPEKIKIQYSFMQANDYFLTSHGYIANLNASGFQSPDSIDFKVLSRSRFILGNPIFTPTVMVRRPGFFPFDHRFSRMEDYKCWYENFQEGRVATINSYLAGGFKHPIGDSGLSGAVGLMHKDYVLVLRCLYKEKKISLPFYISAQAVECIKYPVRLFLLKVRNLKAIKQSVG
jgi:glycosyltransferase involved in cell wall biosynthesis